MRVPIVMQPGYDVTTGRIRSWLKAVGDKVHRGEPIAEIETDKATVTVGPAQQMGDWASRS